MNSQALRDRAYLNTLVMAVLYLIGIFFLTSVYYCVTLLGSLRELLDGEIISVDLKT